MNIATRSILVAAMLAALWFSPCATAEKAALTVGWTAWEPFAYRDSSNQSEVQ